MPQVVQLAQAVLASPAMHPLASPTMLASQAVLASRTVLAPQKVLAAQASVARARHRPGRRPAHAAHPGTLSAYWVQCAYRSWEQHYRKPQKRVAS
ncbi:MAG TPA: hypothetical protein VGF27_10170 [Pseudoduganella sp.]